MSGEYLVRLAVHIEAVVGADSREDAEEQVEERLDGPLRSALGDILDAHGAAVLAVDAVDSWRVG